MDSMTAPAVKLLIAAHSHPAITKGGAEIAAWRLYEGIAARPDWRAWFMGCAREAGAGRAGSVITQPFSDHEFVYSPSAFDWFKFANFDKQYPRELEALLADIAPDIVHFHHYVNYGVETFLHVKRALPQCRIVLTLHEFQAICNHYGQMVTKEKKSLCYEASLRECNKCYPEFSRTDFFLRKAYVSRFFDLVDQFISPSEFLAERYVKWGIPEAKMAVLENVTTPAQDIGFPGLDADPDILRVGFFGQISYLKGIHVALDAARLLEEEGVSAIQFEIHGDYANQPPEFQTDFLERLQKAGRNVRYHGPYENHRVDSLMRSVDLVLVPSIWWENSPVVIQECLRNRRPIVCSDIGGMAEKVRNEKDGFHFGVGSPIELAALLRTLARDREKLARVVRGMRHPDPPELSVDRHLELYRRLLGHMAAPGPAGEIDAAAVVAE
jgi:glycosyltransferase involved in cell wall biosynthesis